MTAPRPCSIADTLGVIGEKYSLLVLREIFFGVRRFDAMTRNIGAPRDVLAARLRHLVAAGVLEKVPYSERPPRFEYRPTAAGRELRPVLLMLMDWGDRHLADPEGPSVIVRHRAEPDEPSCDEPVRVVIECAAGHAPLHARAIQRTPGPAARLTNPVYRPYHPGSRAATTGG